MTRRKAGIAVLPEVEVLDFWGPFEGFSATRLDEGRRRADPSPYEVAIVAERAEVVVARHHGEVVARAAARHMEYPYPEDNRRRI